MALVSNQDLLIGVISGLISCLLFLIYHQLTISNIWFSAPFMLIISGLAGYTLYNSYKSLFQPYSVISWVGFNLYFIIMLCGLSLVSILIFTPEYTSQQIISSGDAPPKEMILKALPVTIIWCILSAYLLVYFITKSIENSSETIMASLILFLTLGLNISILGLVEVSQEHNYLVEKFLIMNAMLGVVFTVSFIIIERILD